MVMKQSFLSKKIFIFTIVMFTLTMVVIACNHSGKKNAPSSPISDESEVINYAQLPEGSIIVNVNGEQHQINFVISDWYSFPYGEWIYAEINEQSSVGKEPGVDQIPVVLNNVVFTFSGLPSEITEIVAAVKKQETEQYTEIGRYEAQDEIVVVPVAWEDLISYLGITHYTLWFQAIGGENGQGIQEGAQIEVSGTLPDAQTITIGKNIRFGTNPKPTPPATNPSPSGPAGPTGDACQQKGYSIGAAATTGIGKRDIWEFNGTGLTNHSTDVPPPGATHWAIMIKNKSGADACVCFINAKAKADGDQTTVADNSGKGHSRLHPDGPPKLYVKTGACP
jgi:hypothetical protein